VSGIFSSSDLSFVEDVMDSTNGLGVDLVLNSLAGELLRASLKCLKTNGKFLELGKADMAQASSLSLGIFWKNISFHGVLLDLIVRPDNETHFVETGLSSLLQNFIKLGIVRPLQRTVFDVSHVPEAFRYMMNRGRMEKVLIQIASPSMTMDVTPHAYFSPAKMYVIAGGLGELGLHFTAWLCKQGARHVTLTSRSGLQSCSQARAVQQLQSTYGANIYTFDANVSDYESMSALLTSVGSQVPIGGIFNLAGILRDALFENTKESDLKAVFEPKLDGTLVLDKLSRELCPNLEHFVVFSSIVSSCGNAGQTIYGYANSAMEGIIQGRNKSGLPGLAIQCGPIAEVGLLAASQQNITVDSVISGTHPQLLNSFLDSLDVIMCGQTEGISASFIPAASSRKGFGNSAGPENPLEALGFIMGLTDVGSVDSSLKLSGLGMDSLMVVETKQVLENKYGIVLSTPEVLELTFDRLKVIWMEQQKPKDK